MTPTTERAVPDTADGRAPWRRAVVIVLDSLGVGELPDAARYGDTGSNTLGNISAYVRLHIPALCGLGLRHVVMLRGIDLPPHPTGAFGRMREASPGKDSVTGHWELSGVVLNEPFPVFPHGFPREVMQAFERRIGRGTLGNHPASGTEVIERYGSEHLRTGWPIVYTSADSVFQVAAHEDVTPVDELYRFCEIAFELVANGLGVGRVIARPFVGVPGRFTRDSARRHDFARAPPTDTLLDHLTRAGWPVVAIGKIRDLFGGRGITTHVPTGSDDEGMDALERTFGTLDRGLVFANLVDFDTVYGHGNDVQGYARNLERFDARLAELLSHLRPDDLLVLTADHGNDPTTASTDHSREHVPLLVAGAGVRSGTDLGERATFADLGQTLAEGFGVGPLQHGTSFLGALFGDTDAHR
ncbi:MAG: phosphopentomutase [Luteitalea sp.]|nr:phosphopentomutase [Luteitalea sp.]